MFSSCSPSVKKVTCTCMVLPPVGWLKSPCAAQFCWEHINDISAPDSVQCPSPAVSSLSPSSGFSWELCLSPHSVLGTGGASQCNYLHYHTLFSYSCLHYTFQDPNMPLCWSLFTPFPQGQFQGGYAQGLGLVTFADGGHDRRRSEGNKTPSVYIEWWRVGEATDKLQPPLRSLVSR